MKFICGLKVNQIALKLQYPKHLVKCKFIRILKEKDTYEKMKGDVRNTSEKQENMRIQDLKKNEGGIICG